MATSDLSTTSTSSDDHEPFGQSGVRQHLGLILDVVCIIVVVLASFLWYRSLGWMDSLEWRGGNQEMTIRSIAGRIRIDTAVYDGKMNSNSGWLYRRRPLRNARDEWAPSLLKTIGFEFSSTSVIPSAVGGFWIRIKWYFVVIVFAAVPAMRALLHWRRSREDTA